MSDEPKTYDIVLHDANAIVLAFKQPGGIDMILDRIESDALSHAPDLSTAKGRDEIKSLAYKVSRSKTAMDEAGKQLTEEQRKQIAVVDADRKKVRDRMDALRDRVRKPLTDWEDAEAARIGRIKSLIAKIRSAGTKPFAESDSVRQAIAETEQVKVERQTFAEFTDEAETAKQTTLASLGATLELVIKREQEAAELALLRAEKLERDRIEQERIAAQQEKERLARLEKERRLNDERNAALAKKQQEDEAKAKADAERAEQQRKLQQAEQDKAKAEAEAAALRKRLADEEAARQKQEKDRQEAERQRLAIEAIRKKERETAAAKAQQARKQTLAWLRDVSGKTHEEFVDAVISGEAPNLRFVIEG